MEPSSLKSRVPVILVALFAVGCASTRPAFTLYRTSDPGPTQALAAVLDERIRLDEPVAFPFGRLRLRINEEEREFSIAGWERTHLPDEPRFGLARDSDGSVGSGTAPVETADPSRDTRVERVMLEGRVRRGFLSSDRMVYIYAVFRRMGDEVPDGGLRFGSPLEAGILIVEDVGEYERISPFRCPVDVERFVLEFESTVHVVPIWRLVVVPDDPPKRDTPTRQPADRKGASSPGSNALATR